MTIAADQTNTDLAPRSRNPLTVITGDREPVVVDTSEPIRPEWLRDRLTFHTTTRNFVRRNAYRGGKWTLNLPAIVALLVFYSPRGLGRVVAALSRYLYDFDSAKVRAHHASNTETPEYRVAQSIRKANLKARWMVAGTLAVTLAGPVLAWTFPRVLAVIVGLALFVWIIKIIPGRGLGEIVVAAVVGTASALFLPMALTLLPRPPAWTLWAALSVVVLSLGWIGRPREKALVKSPTVTGGIVEPLKAPVVMAALCTLGHSKMTEKTQADPKTAIRLLADPHRHGPGVQIDLELPPGVPAAYVMGKRESFAAALRRELGTVWPAVGTRHPGHLALFVSDQPMNAATQRPWPLLKSGEVDLFKPFPAFTDQKGEWQDLTLAYANVIIGAVPRAGKTFTVRELLLCAGLDLRAKVYAIDGKGTGDLSACALFAHFYSVGDEPEEVDRVLDAMRGLVAEMRRRTRVIREMNREDAPESKVTSDLANRPGLEPIVVGIDETQTYFEEAPKAKRDELAALVTQLVKKGPAMGIIVILATQTVNKDTIPTGISNNAVIRFCLKMENYETNDRVLGTGAYKRGIDATMFAQEDVGIGYLKAEGQVARIVRSVWGLDAVASEKVALRARQLRKAVGRLTGMAAGEEMETEARQRQLLDDVAKVFANQGRPDAMHLADIAIGLASLEPGVYGHADNVALAKMLRSAGARVDTVYVAGKPREESTAKGIKLAWLNVAATSAIGEAAEEEQARKLTEDR